MRVIGRDYYDSENKSYIYQHGTLGGLMQDLMEGTEKLVHYQITEILV